MDNQSRIGPFALEERLSADNTGNVYRAIQIAQRRTVALKLFSAPLIKNSAKARAEFVREAKLLRQLVHPNIVRCHGAGLVDMQGYLAMELVTGQSLADLLAHRGKLTWDTVIDDSLQICAGLEFAQQVGLIHLDLTPDKLLLDEEGQIKITDFRLDRPSNGLCATSHQRTASRVTYMAPEQLGQEGEVSHKADLYSLGCVMFQMLAGRPPFESALPELIIDQHLEEEAPRVSSIELDCPVWLDVLVAQLLEKDPRRRPHSATAVMLALKEARKKIAEGTGVAEHATRGFSPLNLPVDKEEAQRVFQSRESLIRRCSRRVVQWIYDSEAPPIYQRGWFLVGCLLVIASVFAWALWPPSEQKLFLQANALIRGGAREDRGQAERLLQNLLQRFPDGQFAAEAQQHLDVIEMAKAESRMRFNAQIGRKPSTLGEQLYAEAWRYEQLGEAATALQRYQHLVQTVPSEGKNKPFVSLANRQIKLLSATQPSSPDHRTTVQQRMDKAEQLLADGATEEARKIWESIVTLYQDDLGMAELVQQAQSRLNEL